MFLVCSCSPCSGEGEGLHPAPGQLLVVGQQPVHQSQRQRRVGVRRRLRLELRVGGRGAAQQEEAARGGQLERGAVKTWPTSRRRGARKGGRKPSLQSSRGSSTPPPVMPTTTALTVLALSPPSLGGLALETPPHGRHNRVSSRPISKNRREEVSTVRGDCFDPCRELQVFSPSLPSLSLVSLVLPSLFFFFFPP